MNPDFDPARPLPSRIPPFSFANAFAEGWRTFKERYAMLLAVSLIYLLIFAAVAYVGDWLDRLVGFPIPSIVINILLLSPLGAGAFYAGASAVRGGPAATADMFLGFSRYWPVVGVGLLITLAMWALGFAGGLVMFVIIMLAQATDLAWLLAIPVGIALIVATIYLGVRLSFALIVAIDPQGPRPGVTDAIRLSWEMTRGAALWLFVLGLCAGLIVLATALLFVLPMLFFGVPLALAVYGAAYAQIAADTDVAPRGWTGRCHWCGYDLSGSVGQVCPECGGELPPRVPPVDRG